MDTGVVDLVKREMSDIRFSQSETDRRTQDLLETVHSTLGHVVDRLSMIEGDLRTVRTAPPAAPAVCDAAARLKSARKRRAIAAPLAGDAAAAEAGIAESRRAASESARTFRRRAARIPRRTAAAPVAAAVAAARDQRNPGAARRAPRAAIAPELPPDHPLEPGTGRTARDASPSERIAASENAISEIPAGPKEPVSSSSFIAAARRAAQAAAAAPPADKPGRGPFKAAQGQGQGRRQDAPRPNKEPSTITSKIRSLLVGASVVVIVLGTFKMAMTLLDSGSAPPMPAMESRSSRRPGAAARRENSARPAMPRARDALDDLADADRPAVEQFFRTEHAGRRARSRSRSAGRCRRLAGYRPATSPARSRRRRRRRPAASSPWCRCRRPNGCRTAIGGPVLRAAALKGDAAAAYEIGVRFAEGKGVAANFDEAAKWYDRAAQAGVVPAIFRLGTLYEKGLSVKKDVDIARRYYMQAAERGNAKAMHNLAVLDADGGGKGANYKSASQWFRKAADRGVADSQFNLGILYARGIGVEQNLAESFKWFSLAAAQGDADSVRKRDDIAKRLDAQSLAAAKLAIQTFTPEPQPDDAINVAAPAGGWDSAPAQASAAKPAAKPVATKRAAAAH